MILDVPSNYGKISIDGINMRIAVLSKEMDIISSAEIEEIDQDRKCVSKRDLRRFKDIVDSQSNKDILIKKLASTQKKFDVMSGFAITESDLYSFLLSSSLTALQCGLKKEEFDPLMKVCKNIPNLYRTFNFFASQLYAKSTTSDSVMPVNVDSSFTDSDGKQMNIASNIPIEEDNEISDQTIRLRYKVYLDFLYNASCAVKGTRNESSILSNIYPLLSLLWMEDSFRSYKEEANITIVGKDYNKETYNKMLFPITYRKNNELECKLSKTDVKLPTEVSTSYNNLEIYLKASCLRTYTKHKQNMECIDKISTDCFVFARYIFRMFQILGIDIIDKNRTEPYSKQDILRCITDTNNPNSLVNLIPEYKFSPNFYNHTKSLKDWFEQSYLNINDDYSINKYTALESRISQPVFSTLSTTGTGHYPLSVQSKNGANLDTDIEVQHILQLMHLNKLLGTGVTHSDLYSKLLNSKMDRVILFEPMLTASSSKPVGSRNISEQINVTLSNTINDIYYRILGLNIHMHDELIDIRNSGSTLPETSEDVKEVIDNMIQQKIEKIADIYLKHYYTMGWNFPFMSRRENLIDMIRNTKREDFGSGFLFLLGDCLTLKVHKETSTGKFSDPVECALTGNYKFVADNTIYIPFLYEETIKVSESDYKTYYAKLDTPVKIDRNGRYAVKVTRLGVKNPIIM